MNKKTESLPRIRIFLSPPYIGGEEEKFVRQAFESNYIAPLGPQVDAFEKEFSEYTGLSYCVAVSSGTAAMHLALHHLGICPGAEIYASTLTFIGSISPATFLGANLVFIDCDRKTWNMDADLLEEELNKAAVESRLPKAVVPTDLYGQCADYGRIYAACKKYDVPVIIDAAEALGARYNMDGRPGLGAVEENWVHAGKGARAAVFSFNGNKIITTSGGGMLASDDNELIEHARFLSQQARDPFPHYEHTEIGYNYRMSNILAAIGRGQLKVLEERVKRKREIFEYYKTALGNIPGIEFMPEAPYGRSNRWLTVVLITPEEFGADREAVRLALEAENIESRPMWKPMHMQPVFQTTDHSSNPAGCNKTVKRYSARVVGGDVAEDLFGRGLCLPSGTAMTDNELNRVIEVIISCRK